MSHYCPACGPHDGGSITSLPGVGRNRAGRQVGDHHSLFGDEVRASHCGDSWVRISASRAPSGLQDASEELIDG